MRPPGMGLPAVSVVVPSWRRPAELTRCLVAVAEQLRPGDEVLPVVRRDDLETLAAVEALAERAELPPISAIHPVKPGLVAALSAGLEAAANPVVCFTDDDAVPRSDWIAHVRAHFGSDPRIGAVGGRDWIHVDRATNAGTATRVGQVRWFGRVIGNHHLGTGAPRAVQILKGVNMSFRRTALAAVGFDELLWGATSQPHNEVGLCLQLQRLGWRLIYDPQVAVDHYLAARAGDSRGASPGRKPADVAEAAHNQLYGLLVGLRGWRRITVVLYQLLVGSREDPGPALCLERLAAGREGQPALRRTWAAARGRLAALQTYRRRRRQ